MTRKTVVVIAGFLAVMAMVPVKAADLPRPQTYRTAPAYVAPAFTWQGPYVGFNGGYGWGTSTLTATTGSSSISPSGAVIGSTLGYNFQANSFVFGVEGDADYSWMRKTNGAVAPCPSCEVRNHYLATVRGRFGYAMDRWLPYVTGGLAVGDIQVSTPAGTGQYKDKLGWTFGGGVEYALPASNWSAKLEYLYANLGSANCDAAHCGISTDVNFRASVARVGVNYRF